MHDYGSRKLIIVGGPTASGKTGLGIRIAQHYKTEVISADSRQIYRELNIGVARPTKEELGKVVHHFIADHSIFQPLNAGSYADKARTLINELFKEHDVLVVVGGTGLYIKALLEGMDKLPPANEALRKELKEVLNNNGIEALQARISDERKRAMNEDDLKNPQRLIRAIEIEQGEPVSSADIRDFEYGFDVIKLAVDLPREYLYDRINRRVDLMVSEGLEQEAMSVQEHKDLIVLRTVGYTEWFKVFDGEYTKEQAIDKIKQHSRNYAKRQLTWFRRDPEFIWISEKEAKGPVEEIIPS